MATVSIPAIPSPPTTGDLPTLFRYVRDLASVTAVLAKELNFQLNGSLDINNIRASAIPADRLAIAKLSDITANLGHVTLGLLETTTILNCLFQTMRVQDWGNVRNVATGHTLQTDLDAKANVTDLATKANAADLAAKANVSDLATKADAFTGITGTFYVSATSGGPADVPVTFVNGIRTT